MSGGGKDKIAVFPSRMYTSFHILSIYYIYSLRAQTTMKTRLKCAQKGHSLLKKKADALNFRFREILRKIVEVAIAICCKSK